MSFTTGIVPNKLKIAKIVLLFKKNNPEYFENYRPVALISIFAKLLEKLMYNRLYDFLTIHNILIPVQFGFRKNHSTSLSVLNFSDYILQELDKGIFCCGVFMDLCKAFDTIDHHILLKELFLYGLRGIPLQWFQNYLHERKQYVVVDGVESTHLTIDIGVPQGSVLGPLLFLIYVNDIIRSSNLLQNADPTNYKTQTQPTTKRRPNYKTQTQPTTKHRPNQLQNADPTTKHRPNQLQNADPTNYKTHRPNQLQNTDPTNYKTQTQPTTKRRPNQLQNADPTTKHRPNQLQNADPTTKHRPNQLQNADPTNYKTQTQPTTKRRPNYKTQTQPTTKHRPNQLQNADPTTKRRPNQLQNTDPTNYKTQTQPTTKRRPNQLQNADPTNYKTQTQPTTKRRHLCYSLS